MKEVFVFYAGQVYWRFSTFDEFRYHCRRSLIDSDIYNGGYALHRNKGTWWRLDLTPILLEDVPTELRVLALILP